MKILTLEKAFRVNDNEVKVLYYHNERKQEFVITWNNIHPETGKISDYDLQLECLSSNDELNNIVINAIKFGEDNNNPHFKLYLEMRDSFDRLDCKSI